MCIDNSDFLEIDSFPSSLISCFFVLNMFVKILAPHVGILKQIGVGVWVDISASIIQFNFSYIVWSTSNKFMGIVLHEV
jgi:hypothetical protein